MAKSLKTIGVAIVFAGVVLATAGAALIPAVAGGGIFGAFGTAAFGLTASQWIGLGSLVSSLGTALDKPAGTGGGNPTDWSADPNAPLHFAAGRIGIAGNIVRMVTFGPDSMYQGIVTVFSSAGPIKAFERFTGDDQQVTFNGSGMAVSSQWTGEMWRKISYGMQPDTALVSPSGLKNNATMPGWTAQHKLSGKAATMLVLGENSKRTAYPTGIPKQLEVIQGLYGWDPRLDSTYPGGSGACRLNNPATWVYLTDPNLWALKWTLGLWEGPTGKGAPFVDRQVGGIGASIEAVDVAAFVACANVSQGRSWTVCGWPSTDDDEGQVLADFLQAGGSIRSFKAGRISCVSRATPRVSVVTVTAQDTAGDIELDAAQTRIGRFNSIIPTYRDENARWEMIPGNEVTASAYQTADQGQRPRGVTYSFVSSYQQAAELAALDIAHSREGISGVIPMKPYMQDLEAGQAFTINEEGFLLNNLKCLCLNNEYDSRSDVCRVTFVSETDAKYSFAFGQSPNAPTIPALTPTDTTYVSPPGLVEWTVVPRPPSTVGGQVPGFDISGLVQNDTATAILVEWGPTNTGPWTQAYLGPPTAERIPVNGVQPGQSYYISITNVRGQNMSVRRVLGPYTAPTLTAVDTVNVGGVPAGTVNTNISNLRADLDTSVSNLNLAIGTANNAVSALDDRLDTIEYDVNNTPNGVKFRVGQTEGVANNAAYRVGVVESQVNTPATGLLARVADLTTATSNLQTGKADATRVFVVEASAKLLAAGEYVNSNPTFLGYVQSTGSSPAGWRDWSNGTQHTTVQGQISDKALRWVVSAGQSYGIVADHSDTGHFKGPAAPGWWVLEATVTLEAGTLSGAGLLLQNPGGSNEPAFNFAAAINPLTGSAYGAGVAGRTYHFSELYKIPATAGRFLLYQMASWDAYDGARPAKTLVFHSSGVRPATAAEIENGVARADFGSVSARFIDLTTATGNLQTGKASVERVGLLESRTRSTPNLIENGDFSRPLDGIWFLEGGAGPSRQFDGQIGNYLNLPNTYVVSKPYPAATGQSFSVSFDGFGTTGANVYLQALPSYALLARASVGNQGNWETRKYSDGSTAVAPTGTTGFRVVIDPAGTTMGVSRIKVNYGGTATYWSDEGTSRETYATIITKDTAQTTALGAEASRRALLEASTIGGLASTFENPVLFTNNYSGNALSPRPDSIDGTFPIVSGEGKVWQYGGTDVPLITTKAVLRLFDSRTYTITFRYRLISSSGNTHQTLYGWGLYDLNGNYIGSAWMQGSFVTRTIADGWINLSATLTGAQIKALSGSFAGAVYLSPQGATNWGPSGAGGTGQIALLRGEDGTATAAVAARVTLEEAATAELRARPAPGGNLLGNTTFETTDGWTYVNYSTPGGYGQINLLGAAYTPAPDNQLGICAGAPGGFADWFSDVVAVIPGTTLEFGGWAGRARVSTLFYLGLTLADGSNEIYLDAGFSNNQGFGGGNNLAGYERAWNKRLVPSGYTRARLIMRFNGTNAGEANSFAWFARPYICEIPAGQTGPGTFSHGMPRWSLRAKWQVGVAIPGASAFIQAVASNADGPATSSVAIGARSVAIYNPVGQDWKKALEVVDGNAIFTGGLQAGTFIRLGSGEGWPVALKSVDFNLSDGEVCSFGTNLGALPTLSFAQNNLAPLSSGETYSIYADSFTPTGFTMRAKISVPATPSTQSVAGPGYADTVGSLGSGRTLYLEARPLALDGSYNLTFSGQQSHRFFSDTTDNSDVTVTCNLWAYNGSWQNLGPLYANSFEFNPGVAATVTNYWSETQVVSLPSGTSHVNVARVSATNSRTGSLDSTGPINWQSQGSGSGVRSATPSGQKTRVTVRPQ